MLDLPSRPRRNRKSAAIRSFHRETWLSPAHFIYPLFVHDRDGVGDVPIASMPGCARHSVDGLMREVEAARKDGISSIVLFPAVDDARKNSRGDESWNPEGLIPALLRRLKREWPDLVVVTDVALDPYNSDGHDGIVDASGHTPRILNDETVEVLCKQAVCQAEAGADADEAGEGEFQGAHWLSLVVLGDFTAGIDGVRRRHGRRSSGDRRRPAGRILGRGCSRCS